VPDAERKTFTFDEARRLLPQVKERTRRAMEKIGELESSVDDEDGPEEAKEKLEAAAHAVLHEWAAEIMELGVEVKGPWLVDFDSGGGYYCWKWPEESLEYFHSYEEGFSGRVRLQ
jgi:hypothetical protein